MTGNGYREVVDASGKSGNVSGRIQGLFQDVNTPTRDQIWTKRWGVAPSMVYDFQQGTKATLYYIYQGEEGVSDYGFTYLPQPAVSPLTGNLTSQGYYGGGRPTPPLPIPRTNFLGIAGGPLGDITQTDTHIITEKVEHEFDKDLKLSNATRYIDNTRFARVTAPRNVGLANNTFPAGRRLHGWNGTTFPFNYPVDLLTYGRERRERETDNTYLINQTDLVGKFITGIAEHQMAAGLEFARETRHQERRDICELDQPCLPHQCVQSRSQQLSDRRRHHQLPADRDQGRGLCRLCLRPGQDHQIFRAARIAALRLLQHQLPAIRTRRW